jgi:thiosulfate/3-mercaptopyruvate sulfurtransferase
LVELFSKLGIEEGKQVVVYDQSTNMYSARAWWLLRWVGFESVAVLDGGLMAWVEAGEKTVSGETPLTTKLGNFEINPAKSPLVLVDSLEQRIGDPQLCLIDARARERFLGEVEPLDPVAGHIPGAKNHFWKNNVDEKGFFLPPARLKAQFLSLLGDEGNIDQVIHQCGSGVSACHNVLAMEIAGLKGSALYAGSWSEWCSDSSRPMVKGLIERSNNGR